MNEAKIEGAIGQIHAFLAKTYSAKQKCKYVSLAHDTDEGARVLEDFPLPEQADDDKLLKVAHDIWNLAGACMETHRTAQRFVVVRMTGADKPCGQWPFSRAASLSSEFGGVSESPTQAGMILSNFRQVAEAKRDAKDAYDLAINKLVGVFDRVMDRVDKLEARQDERAMREAELMQKIRDMHTASMSQMMELELKVRREHRIDRILGHVETIALSHPKISALLSGGLKSKLGNFVAGLTPTQQAAFYGGLTQQQGAMFAEILEHGNSANSTDESIAVRLKAFIDAISNESWAKFEATLTPEQVHAFVGITEDMIAMLKSQQSAPKQLNGHAVVNGAPTT